LTYNAPDTLELRVFPFQSGERRTTEIEFLAPPGVNAAVDINGRVVELAKSDAPAITMARQERSTQIVLSRESLSTLPVVQRRPYLHFLVDRAAASKLTPEVAIARMREIAAEFPEAQSARVTAANYECEEVTNGALPIDQLRTIASIPASRWLPARGSFLQDRAILKVLLDAQDAAAESGQDSLESAALSFPIVISLQSTPPLDTAGSALAYVGSSLPDVAGYYRCDSAEGAPSPIRFDGSPMKEERFPIQPVVVLRQSGHLAFCGHGETASLSFPGTTASAAVEVYDSASQKFRTVTGITRLPEQSRYARGTAVWRKNRIILENPSSALRWLPEIIDESRDSGVLVPASSYIVVENSAQWKMLQLKQQQKLKRNQSLDFMDTPEPSVWVVGLLTLALSVLWSLLRRRLPVQSSARS
jgi:hypothetical protein